MKNKTIMHNTQLLNEFIIFSFNRKNNIENKKYKITFFIFHFSFFIFHFSFFIFHLNIKIAASLYFFEDFSVPFDVGSGHCFGSSGKAFKSLTIVASQVSFCSLLGLGP